MPVGLLSTHGVIEYEFRASRYGTITANSASNIYLNSSASLTGATQIGARGTGTVVAQKNMSHSKKILFNETQIQITSPSIAAETDIVFGGNNFVHLRQNIIISANNFLILSFLNNNTTSISELFGVSIKIYK